MGCSEAVRRRSRSRAAFITARLAVLAGAALLSGCGAIEYYAQSIGGHLQLLGSARPVDDWLADPVAPQRLRQRLQLSQQIRTYAVDELKLPDNASYRRYADLRRPAAVWNVVAAPELSLKLHAWCYPVVGCVSYRGYFERAAAEREVAALRARGFEAGVYAVPAYSTLGMLPGRFFADPLLNTFIELPDGELARMIFHELAHQVAYAPGDTVFNESFATTVEQLGAERWLRSEADAAAREAYARYDARRRRFREFTQGWRGRLDALYRSSRSDADKRVEKAALMARMRDEYANLKATEWQGFAGYDAWFERANNAAFGVLAAYNEAVPKFERLFARSGGNFEGFYDEVRRLAALPASERNAELQPFAAPLP